MSEVTIAVGNDQLGATLDIPNSARGIVVFAHGSGSSRFSPRNRHVAAVLRQAEFGTLLMDLLTAEEGRADEATAEIRFDIPRLASRLASATDWLRERKDTQQLAIGYFGASTGAAAALVAAADRADEVSAVVSRGGRPDLANAALTRVKAPTLLLVGSLDRVVIDLNSAAMEHLTCEKILELVPGATHLFEEAGALDEVARHASAWFRQYLRRDRDHAA